MGTINDFPLANFVSNTPLGYWLFPYSFANRAAYHSYMPITFNRFVAHELRKPRQKPLFLAIHFTLSHWPFAWAQSPGV
ncbi:hypothetical protein ABTH92_21180, partial [Acinetobacter baumannii]